MHKESIVFPKVSASRVPHVQPHIHEHTVYSSTGGYKCPLPDETMKIFLLVCILCLLYDLITGYHDYGCPTGLWQVYVLVL